MALSGGTATLIGLVVQDYVGEDVKSKYYWSLSHLSALYQPVVLMSFQSTKICQTFRDVMQPASLLS